MTEKDNVFVKAEASISLFNCCPEQSPMNTIESLVSFLMSKIKHGIITGGEGYWLQFPMTIKIDVEGVDKFDCMLSGEVSAPGIFIDEESVMLKVMDAWNIRLDERTEDD